MKKLLLFLVLMLSFTANAQTVQEIEEIAKQKFQKYVEETFKDPYSYELKKITVKPETRQEVLEREMSVSQGMMDTPVRRIRKEYEAKLKEQTDVFNSLTEAQKKEIYQYSIFIDAYGANSYGNKVLGRYYFDISSDGKLIEYIKKWPL